MAATNLGRVVPLYKGTYSAAAQYEKNDIVAYSGKVYWHTGSTPTTGTAPTDTTVWTLMVEPGALPSTTNLVAGDGSGGSADSGLDPALIAYAGAAQTLTDGQKTQARTNISAADAGSVAALEAENALQGMQIANLKAALYGTVIEDAEHTFAALGSASIPSHISVGTAYHKVFDGSELMIGTISGRTVQGDGALVSAGLDGIRVSGAAGSTAEPWEFELAQPQTIDGVDGVADTIEIVEAGNGLYNVVKTTRFASVDMGTLTWKASSVADGFYTIITSSGAKYKGKAMAYGYAARYDSPTVTVMSDMEIAVANSIANPNLILRNAAFRGFTVGAVKTALSGQTVVLELLTPVTTTIATGLTEAQVACLTERGGSIAVIGNDNTGIADPDVTVILQIEKAVEE